MPELAVPLLLLGLIGLVLIRRRLVPATVGTAIAWLLGLGLGGYLVLDVLPWVGGEATGALRVEIAPAGAAGVSADGTPVPIHVRVYGGPVLVREEVIGPAARVPAAAQTLRIERIEGTSAVRVLRGDTVLGELSPEAVADLRATPEVPIPAVYLDADPGPVLPILGSDRELRRDDELGGDGELARRSEPDLSPSEYRAVSVPDDSEAVREAWARLEALEREAAPDVAAPPESSPSEDTERYERRYETRGREVRARPEVEPEPAADEPRDSELGLRARAMSLAVRSPCRAASLLSDASEPRSRDLRDDLLARCKRTLR